MTPSDRAQSCRPPFQVHWSRVPAKDVAVLTSRDCHLVAVWPSPVNHDVCFSEAGFTLFGDNDEDWDAAAEQLLGQFIDSLSKFGAAKYLSQPLKNIPPWYLRPFRIAQELAVQQQALLPMRWDSLPSFHAQFGQDGAALLTGGGHFLMWIGLPHAGPDASEFVKATAGPHPIVETELRWAALLHTGHKIASSR